MYEYYAAPVRRTGRNLSVNPLGGSCVLTSSPLLAYHCLGWPKPSDLIAVWLIGRADTPDRGDLTLKQAASLCSQIPPSRIYVYLDEDTVYPLALDAAVEVQMEVGRADAD